MSRVSIIAPNPRDRPVPFIKELRVAWTFTNQNSFTWNSAPPLSSPYTFDSDLSLSGEIVIPGGRAGQISDGFYSPNDFNAGIPEGEGRTMFAPLGFRVGFFNAPGVQVAGEDQAVTLWDEVFEYDDEEPNDTQVTFTGETAENIRAEVGLTIYRSKLSFSFLFLADIVGRLVTNYADPGTADTDVEATGATITWSVTQDLDTTTSGPFSEWNLSLTRDPQDFGRGQDGTETLDLTVTVVAWGTV